MGTKSILSLLLVVTVAFVTSDSSEAIEVPKQTETLKTLSNNADFIRVLQSIMSQTNGGFLPSSRGSQFQSFLGPQMGGVQSFLPPMPPQQVPGGFQSSIMQPPFQFQPPQFQSQQVMNQQQQQQFPQQQPQQFFNQFQPVFNQEPDEQPDFGGFDQFNMGSRGRDRSREREQREREQREREQREREQRERDLREREQREREQRERELRERERMSNMGVNDMDIDSILFNNEKCGQVRPTVTKFVAGGAPMSHHEHPWYCQIIIHNNEFTESETYCGGTLIHPEWVLTAAHCYDDMQRDRLHRATHVVFRGLHGINRRFTAKVDFVKVHKEYVPAMLPWEAEAQGLKPGPFNDMALLHLDLKDVPAPIRARLVPACMPAPGAIVSEGSVCKVMGHGFMNAEDEKRFRMPSELQGAKVRISSNRACQDDVESRTIKEKINERTTCVRGRIHPCVGDSGGPLVCTGSSPRRIEGSDQDSVHLKDENVMKDSFEPRRWYLVGVTSFAVSTDEHDHCGTFKSAVFGLVSSQVEWVRDTILAFQQEQQQSGGGSPLLSSQPKQQPTQTQQQFQQPQQQQFSPFNFFNRM